MKLLALGCLLVALVLALRDLRRDSLRSRHSRAQRAAVLRRVAAIYDRSRAGRRLAVRLWRAQVHMSPSSWRIAQVLLAIPIATTLVAAGLDAAPAFASASTATRVGGALVLWVRRRACATALDSAAPLLARGLATQLAAWGSGAQAVERAASRCAGNSSPAAARVLQGAAARVLLGGDAASSLHRAMSETVPRLPVASDAARVAAVFALHRHDAAATSHALERLASALEDQAALRSDVRAAFAEVRMSAVAVPLIAAATLAMLLATDPPALVAALTLPLLPMLAVAAVVVVCASLGVRKLVST
jgi:Flp pilus assembly protein TadB